MQHHFRLPNEAEAAAAAAAAAEQGSLDTLTDVDHIAKHGMPAVMPAGECGITPQLIGEHELTEAV